MSEIEYIKTKYAIQRNLLIYWLFAIVVSMLGEIKYEFDLPSFQFFSLISVISTFVIILCTYFWEEFKSDIAKKESESSVNDNEYAKNKE